MSYPTTIAPGYVGYDAGNSARGRFAFEYTTNTEYAFIRLGGGAGTGTGTATADFKLHALKSTDAGLTWTEQDSANAPTILTSAGFNGFYTIAHDGTKVIALEAYGTSTTSTTVNLLGFRTWNFTVGTDTWGTASAYTSPVPDYSRPTNAPPYVDLAVRGANDYILFHNGARSSTHGRVYYATYDGTAFGTATIIPNQSGTSDYQVTSIICDTSGLTHFFYHEITGVGTGDQLHHVSMTTAGSFGTDQVLATNIYQAGGGYSENGLFSEAITYVSSSTETLGITTIVTDTAFNLYQVMYNAPTGVNPTWGTSTVSDKAISAGQGFYLSAHALSLTTATGTLFTTWVVGEDSGPTDLQSSFFLYAMSPTGTLSWTPEQIAFEPPAPYFATYQVYSYPTTIGAGVLGISVGKSPNLDAEYAQFSILAPAGSGGTSTITNTVTNTTTTTTTTTTTATGTGLLAPKATMKLWQHNNAARPEPPRVLNFVSDRVTGSEQWWKEVVTDLNPLGGTTTGVIFVDDTVISTFSMINPASNLSGIGRTTFPIPFPTETYGKAVHVLYTSTTPFKYYRTWYDSEPQPDRMTFSETTFQTEPSLGIVHTWLAELNPLGGSVVGVVKIDGIALMTNTFTGTLRYIYELGLPNTTTGKTIQVQYTSTTNFKHWRTAVEINPRPYTKKTWNISYHKLGGATQLDFARFWSFEVAVDPVNTRPQPGPGTATITTTWFADSAAVLTNTFVVATHTYFDRVSFPPGIRGYLFRVVVDSPQPYRVYNANIDIDRVGVKGFSRVSLKGTPDEPQNTNEVKGPMQIRPYRANYD